MKQTYYSIEATKDKVVFHSNNEELMEDIKKYIQNCIDALQWRSRVVERKRY